MTMTTMVMEDSILADSCQTMIGLAVVAVAVAVAVASLQVETKLWQFPSSAIVTQVSEILRPSCQQ